MQSESRSTVNAGAASYCTARAECKTDTVTTGFLFLNFLLAFRMKIRYRWLEDKEGIAER